MNEVRVRGIIFHQDAIIVIKRRRIVDNKYIEYYVFPGGGMETGENEENALKREICEELGIKVKINKKVYEDVFNGDIHKYFVCEYESGVLGTGNGPEFSSEKYKDRGEYIPVAVSIKNLANINLEPYSIRDKITIDF